MKRKIAWLLLAALIVLFPWALRLPPAPPLGLAAKKYEGFSGVLRLWVCEGWQSGSGSCSAWLNQCLTAFEKRHRGVYVQPIYVSAQTMRDFASETITSPDLVLFAPGVLASADALCPLEAPDTLLPSLADAGRLDGTLYALPVALGGYAFALNRAFLSALPEDWSALSDPASSRRGETVFLMNVPPDDDFHSHSAALIALLGGVRSENRPAPLAGEGLELGLVTPRPTESPEAAPDTIRYNALPIHLPDSFRMSDRTYSDFTNGKCAALTVTQREIRRLQLLDDAGKGPDWQIACGGECFTDQLLFCAVPDLPRTDAARRTALAHELLSWLLSDACQSALSLARAFPATDIAPLYTSDRALSSLENALRGPLLTPNAFSDVWRAQAAALADALCAGTLTEENALAALKTALAR